MYDDAIQSPHNYLIGLVPVTLCDDARKSLDKLCQLITMVLSSSCLLRVQVVPEELASVMTQVAQNIEAQLRNPLYHYHHKVRLINYGGCYYFEPMTLETLAKVMITAYDFGFGDKRSSLCCMFATLLLLWY